MHTSARCSRQSHVHQLWLQQRSALRTAGRGPHVPSHSTGKLPASRLPCSSRLVRLPRPLPSALGRTHTEGIVLDRLFELKSSSVRLLSPCCEPQVGGRRPCVAANEAQHAWQQAASRSQGTTRTVRSFAPSESTVRWGPRPADQASGNDPFTALLLRSSVLSTL